MKKILLSLVVILISFFPIYSGGGEKKRSRRPHPVVQTVEEGGVEFGQMGAGEYDMPKDDELLGDEGAAGEPMDSAFSLCTLFKMIEEDLKKRLSCVHIKMKAKRLRNWGKDAADDLEVAYGVAREVIQNYFEKKKEDAETDEFTSNEEVKDYMAVLVAQIEDLQVQLAQKDSLLMERDAQVEELQLRLTVMVSGVEAVNTLIANRGVPLDPSTET